jgi:hypothetical protein
MTECSFCGSTDADVRIELLAEGETKFSREPYRIVECDACGEREEKRMNDAPRADG